MSAFHAVLGFSVVGSFALLALWGLATWLLKRGPGRAFWWLVAFLQVVLLSQIAVGLALLAIGRRQGVLHVLYGSLFPILVLAAAHWLARDAFEHRPWVPFAIGGFFGFGLTLRALTTGLGIG